MGRLLTQRIVFYMEYIRLMKIYLYLLGSPELTRRDESILNGGKSDTSEAQWEPTRKYWVSLLSASPFPLGSLQTCLSSSLSGPLAHNCYGNRASVARISCPNHRDQEWT